MRGEGFSRAPIATPAIAALVFSQLVLYGLSSGPRAYGHMSDEFYYLDCASRLAWGYVDHPPLSLLLLAGVKATLGTSLLALRLLPALAACLNVWLVAMLARELGGGRTAQSLAALGAATSPVYIAVLGFYSMNSFEPAFWSGAMLLLARIANDGLPRDWLLLGLVLGLGLLNKVSMLWLGAGLAVGLVMTGQRHWLLTPWPYLCGGIAAALFAPHLWWQAGNDWPTLEFMRNARETKMLVRTPLEFLGEQLVIWAGSVPLWLAGIAFYLSRAGREQRWLGWIWLTVIVLLALSGTARANYSAPAFAALLAGGGVALENARGWRRAVPVFAVALMLTFGLGSAPLSVPLLPPADVVRYTNAIGFMPADDEKSSSGLLPLHLSLRFGWKELADAVARATEALSPGERLGSVVLAPNFGSAGAINFHRKLRSQLPPAVSGHNNYWLWGPGEADGEVVIAIAYDAKRLERWYREVEQVADVDCEYCRPDVERYRVYVARGLRHPLAELWADLKRFE